MQLDTENARSDKDLKQLKEIQKMLEKQILKNISDI